MHRLLCISIAIASLCGCGAPPADDAPEGALATAAALRPFDSCDALVATLRANLKLEMRAVARQWKQPVRGDLDAMTGDAQLRAQLPPAAVEGVDYSGTNNQESGVDEADWVKTDGTSIYVINGSR